MTSKDEQTNSSFKRYRNLFGPCSLLLSGGGGLCWYSASPPRPLWFGVIGRLFQQYLPILVVILPILAFITAIIAGSYAARWWFLAALFPAYLLFLLPMFEQPNIITLQRSSSEGVVFDLAGTGRIISFGVGRYSADAQAPNDPRFVLWQIEPKERDKGKLAWQLGTIKYGIVPDGYRQIFPEHKIRPAALKSNDVYYVADYFVHGYFEIVNGRPRWVSNLPELCFVIENDKWVRVPCDKQ